MGPFGGTQERSKQARAWHARCRWQLRHKLEIPQFHLCEIVKIDPKKIKYDTSRYVGAKSKNLDNTKLDKFLPNKVRTPLKEGLEVTVTWMEKELFA